jgi:beta-galactosidase
MLTVYPRFYLDVADEMGICVLDETSIWASDGASKMDAPLFWEACKEHLRRFVLRDRNHASVFGWSVSNENKPVITNVFNKPELMEFQKQAWKEWLEIVTTNDPTRPWISSDGEGDGEGILPVTVGHYGDVNSMRRLVDVGKPWGIGEHSMAYYGTPEQVSKYNGERAYESQQGRMEGLANECYHLLVNQRKLGASYVSVFNIAWYALKPLPLSKKELSVSPSLTEDGVFFGNYVEGIPGVQPERIGPYCSTFNPGYDPNLPLYDAWPMFDAIRAANAPGEPAWSQWKREVKEVKEVNEGR